MRASDLLALAPLLERSLGTVLYNPLQIENDRGVNFLEPKGEEALTRPDSISWRIFKNPVALFVGGIAAVLLELAEPRVRTAVWEQSQFRSQALQRIRRTGLAALTTVYGPRSAAVEMISHIVRIHGNIRGATPTGQQYCANDPELLTWVHATATFSFFQAYSQYVCPLQGGDMDSFCREGLIAAGLYGAANAPASHHDMQALFLSMQDNLEPSPILFDFLQIIRSIPILPAILRPLQESLVRAAVTLVPQEIRHRLKLADFPGFMAFELGLVKKLGRISDRTLIQSNPAVQACIRLGLPNGYLYLRRCTASSGDSLPWQ
jgi:uncharacterized protein (DUF2236 family)